MSIKKFNELLIKGIVKKQSPNNNRAAALIEESDGKYNYLLVSLKSIPEESLNSNVLVDSCYDIIMELIRAKMHLDGYNAGPSHEAEVSYMQVLRFSEPDIRFMDELRYYRNGIKYYGTKLDLIYANQTISFTKKIRLELKKLLKKPTQTIN